MRRSLAVVVALFLPLMSLSACYLGPDPVQYAALAMVDGRPSAVVAVCGRPTVHVELYLNDDTSDDDLHLWSVRVTLPDQVRDVDVELLGTVRPGWEITSPEADTANTRMDMSDVRPLMSIDPGHHYVLDSSAPGPEGARAPTVNFTTADLLRIGAGQVLATTGYKSSRLVPRDAFIKKRCG